jgi:hypothetical protein
MKKAKKPKSQAAGQANEKKAAKGKPPQSQAAEQANEKKPAEGRPPLVKRRGYVIRFTERPARLRAIMILGEVGKTYHVFGDHEYLLEPEHVEALVREGIPFEDVT